ncbi:MAG: type II secretory pathway, component PulD [Saprospiraceae bacterium]|nr:type II secretory pathway, component PulD [Saprospiraceae bacterium]
MKLLKIFHFSLFLLSLNFEVAGQQNTPRLEALALKLEEYALENPKIEKEIDISITGTLQDLAIAFSRETKLNLTIDPAINPPVVVNFSETKPRDILLHLCRLYNLDLVFSGSIITLIPHREAPKKYEPKEIDAKYNAYNGKLELNLHNDTLDYVLKKISQLTSKNIIATKLASNEQVSGYIGQTNIDDALEQLAKRNELTVVSPAESYFVFDKAEPGIQGSGGESLVDAQNRRRQQGQPPQGLTLESVQDSLSGNRLLTLEATDVAVMDIIKQASLETEQSFFYFTLPEERISLNMEKVTYDELLTYVLRGTKCTYRKDGKIYLIGERTFEGLRETKVVQLQHRTVKDVMAVIPKELSQSLNIQEFVELNSLILSGSPVSITEVERFLTGIDKSVPVITIELLIVDFSSNNEVRLGLEAGVSKEAPAAGGSIYPGLDFTFSATAINKLLALLAGNGIVNLGRVQPNFYATLQAVEDNGFAKVLSKPRLSTINGKEAKLSIGETRYYQIERTTLQGNESPISLQERRFESVNADFTINITPVISGDESVTLQIAVSQSDFLGQIQPNAPPPSVSRSFTSNIRLFDKEMVVLGGLESKSIEDSGTGVPWISRVPVLKWFFSKRRRAKNKSQLLIFVRPNIIY